MSLEPVGWTAAVGTLVSKPPVAWLVAKLR